MFLTLLLSGVEMVHCWELLIYGSISSHVKAVKLDVHKVVGMCHCDNLRSASVMQKAGMTKQGVFRKEYQCGGKWREQFYFSILERE